MTFGEPVLRVITGDAHSQGRLALVCAQEREPLTAAVDALTPAAEVVLLVTDIVDFTGLLERLGDLHALSVMRAHDRLLREQLRRFGGREVAHTGDGLVARFDDADRSVGCAAAIQRRLASFRREQPLTPVHVRIGLHHGPVLADGAGLFGSTVVAAVRVCSQAAAGEVLLSRAVHARLEPGLRARTRALGNVPLKGFARPLALHALPCEHSA